MRATIVGMTAIVTVLSIGSFAPAQTHRRNIYSTPAPPPPEVLKRLNLHQAWRGYVPMDGQKDGLLYAALDGKDLLILTRSGLVTRLDAETGVTHWRVRVGKPYTLLPYLASNRRSVYVIANATIHSLNRDTGVDNWEYPLSGGITAAPAVDKTRIFVPTASSVLFAFNLPYFTSNPALTGGASTESLVYSDTSGDVVERTVTPRPIWTARTNLLLAFRPLLSRREIMVVSPDGKVISYSKTPPAPGRTTELFTFDLDHRITVPPTAFADTAYLGCDDSTLYAVNMRTGRLRWRHTAGTAISRSPVILDTDIYVTSEREGLTRLDRDTGEPLWKLPQRGMVLEGNPKADRFLAANTRFVYASDHSGRLLILDRKRGTTLSSYDTSAFRFPIVNDITDRLYLAANDGLIVCLHDQDQREPLMLRKALQDIALQKILNERILEIAGRETLLQEVLADIELRYDLDFVVDQHAFGEARLPNPVTRSVRPPAWENRPLGEYLKQILAQAGATYVSDQDTLLIVPLKPKAKE